MIALEIFTKVIVYYVVDRDRLVFLLTKQRYIAMSKMCLKEAKTIDDAFQCFESIKKIDDEGNEYWSARDLQGMLGYSKWDKFDKVIGKAKISLEKKGLDVNEHLPDAGKTSPMPNGGEKDMADYHMSREACYITCQNGDPRKMPVAIAQNYFADRTISDEQALQQKDDVENMLGRYHFTEDHKALSISAMNSGVPSRNLGYFHNEGQKRMNGGYTTNELKELKGVPEDVNYCDVMSPIERSANEIRMRLTTRRLDVGDIKTQKEAVEIHRNYGDKVRELVMYDGGIPPERLPVVEPIQQVVKRSKTLLENS